MEFCLLGRFITKYISLSCSNVYVDNFSIDYRAFSIKETKNILMYLMKKRNVPH